MEVSSRLEPLGPLMPLRTKQGVSSYYKIHYGLKINVKCKKECDFLIGLHK